MSIFITGTAGFIGFHLAKRLLENGHSVVGFDAVTNYYDPSLKRARLGILEQQKNYRHVEAALQDKGALAQAYLASGANDVFHFAAQPGVRYSIENPASYIESNIVGTGNLLEVLREKIPSHLVFASTSSVYGGNQKMPFAEVDRTDSQISLYAATKRSCEAMIHSYSHLWNIPSTCVRFFTVYGPWSRPDMALLKFAKLIDSEMPIEVYGQGKMQRDFTFVNDLVESVIAISQLPPELGKPVAGAVDSLSPVAPYRIVNAGGGKPTELMTFIRLLEESLGKKALINFQPMQPGDVVATESDVQLLRALVGTKPVTPLSEGIEQFVQWFRSYSR